MAARLNKRQTEQSRSAIQTTQLLKRLQDHVLGDVEMQQTQITAARILLDRAMPVLAAVEHTGADGGPLDLTIRLTPHGDHG